MFSDCQMCGLPAEEGPIVVYGRHMARLIGCVAGHRRMVRVDVETVEPWPSPST